MDYEEKIRKNIEENRKYLRMCGIPLLPLGNSVHKSPGSKKRPTKKNPTLKSSNVTPLRKSKRLCKEGVSMYLEDEEELVPKTTSPKKIMKRENTFGAIPDVPIGTIFYTRMEASHAGVHRPPIAGIHGNPLIGCYSIALSGGYEDDSDLGDHFVYTGEGGRDLRGSKANPKNLRTAPQSKDQVLERGNLALSLNIKKKLPVRVIRGYKLCSKFAPEEGYRYDGLYKVTKCFQTTGLSGFKVYKFCLEREKNQAPAPWSKDFLMPEAFSTEKNISNEDNLQIENEALLDSSEVFAAKFLRE